MNVFRPGQGLKRSRVRRTSPWSDHTDDQLQVLNCDCSGTAPTSSGYVPKPSATGHTRLEQTGSNPDRDAPRTPVDRIGQGTDVYEGLAVMNTDYSNSRFRVSQVTVGDRNFLGNNIAYTSGARLGGRNVCSATKVMVRSTGPIGRHRPARLTAVRDPGAARREKRGNSAFLTNHARVRTC